MTRDPDELTTLARIAQCPDGATPLHATAIVSYLGPGGEPCMGLSTRGDSTLTERLGILTWAQIRLMTDPTEDT